MTREEVRQSSSGNSPPVDSSVKRAIPATVRPKKKSRRRRQRAGPGRKSWIESAYLFSIVDGEVVSKPVRIKIDTNADGISRMKLAVSTNDSREIVDRTRVPKIRRLNKERAKDSVRGQIVQFPMGVHGDRLNLTEVNP